MTARCIVCGGSGRVLDKAESRACGWPCWADCVCENPARGWELVKANARQLRGAALLRFRGGR